MARICVPYDPVHSRLSRVPEQTEMLSAQAAMLPDGNRLHLHHGPIDLIVKSWGQDREISYKDAARRFETLLQELVDELPLLRSPMIIDRYFDGSVAQRMQEAVSPYSDTFITPMAAVAGSVADEILTTLTDGKKIDKAYVNNGGDAAFHIIGDQVIKAMIAGPIAGKITIDTNVPYRGIATSGWKGRSHSLGIADTVSVVAKTAASADAAATLIANAVDIPEHSNIKRAPACSLSPDSDLEDRLVTIGVGNLNQNEIEFALDRGGAYARDLCSRNLIVGAFLVLKGKSRYVGNVPKYLLSKESFEPTDASHIFD